MRHRVVPVMVSVAVAFAGCTVGQQAPSSSVVPSSPVASSATTSTTASATPTQSPTSSAAVPEMPTPSASTSSAQAPLTMDALLTAPVPSLCDHPAGRLVDGSLPGVPANRGGVRLAGFDGARWKDRALATTWVGSDGRPYAAAVVDCNQGGVSWPQRVLVYTEGLKLVGAFDLAEVLGEGRQSVQSLSRDGDSLSLKVANTYQSGDAACCGTLDHLLTITVGDGRASTAIARTYDERATAQSAFTALVEGDEAELAKYFAPGNLLRSRREVYGGGGGQATWNPVGGCRAGSEASATGLRGFSGEVHRVCQVEAKDGSWSGVIALEKAGFGQWKVTGVARN